MFERLIHAVFPGSGRHEVRTAHVEVDLEATEAPGDFEGRLKITYWCCCGKKCRVTTKRLQRTGPSRVVETDGLRYALSELWAMADNTSQNGPIHVTSTTELAATVIGEKHKYIIVHG
jgi:hypothetical protein